MNSDQWEIEKTKKLEKQINALPKDIKTIAYALMADIEDSGAYQPSWPNYSSLKKGKGIPADAFHCHLKRGKPTYVACWCITDKKRKIIEVYYVGTHENAPY